MAQPASVGTRGASLFGTPSTPRLAEGPENLLHVFCRDGKGGWKLDEESLRRADDAGCGFKTERGDRAAVIMTPEEGARPQCNGSVRH